MLASAAIFATSCLSSGVSKSDYTIIGNFEGYASSDQMVAQYFKDSLRFAKQILTDDYSCLNSDYDENNSIFNGGFCLSMKKDSLNAEKTGISDYSSAGPAAGATNSKVYAVFRYPVSQQYDWQIYLDSFDVGTCSMSGFYIDNVSKTIKAIEDKPLADGDYLTVTITGYLKKAAGKSVSFDLVRSSSMKTTVVTNWTEVDLSSLGNVDALKFTVETNRTDFPLSFCLDNLYASVHLEY